MGHKILEEVLPTKIRYAVVGLGNITQDAFLPAFKNAKNSELAALVTGDKKKSDELAKRYRLDPSSTYGYEEYDECLKSGKVDAVYIGLPNHLHHDYTIRAAKAGIHVLCEKPMAVDVRECRRMIAACEKASVKLMIAYRLHFEEANLDAIETVTSGRLGDPRMFSSTFSQQVAEDNVRLTEPESRGGGPLFDMGVYCINAARYLFRDEPIEVVAASANNGEIRFRENPEMTSVILRFPQERLATISCSFGAAPASEYSLIGTRGLLRLAPAYDFHKPLARELIVDGKPPKRKKYEKHDQFGAELMYFSDCILKDRKPEPSGEEGLADIRIVQAIMKSARTRKPVRLAPAEKRRRPVKSQEIDKPPVKRPKLINAALPSAR